MYARSTCRVKGIGVKRSAVFNSGPKDSDPPEDATLLAFNLSGTGTVSLSPHSALDMARSRRSVSFINTMNNLQSIPLICHYYSHY